MPNPLKQIICINWGTKYGPNYINRLYAMVFRNITPPFSFTCFTDNSDGIRPEIQTEPLPPLDFELPITKQGIWPKCRLWSKELGKLHGPVLFLDLDIVITGSLDDFFTFGSPDEVILARNPSNPLERLGQTSVYRFPVGKLEPLMQEFAIDPKRTAERYRYEQRFVSQNAPGGIKFWPTRSVCHFRHHCRPIFPFNYFCEPRVPIGSKIIIFPGDLKPQDAIEGRYHEDEPITSPVDHFLRAFSRGRNRGMFAHLRHFILPTQWVDEYWRE